MAVSKVIFDYKISNILEFDDNITPEFIIQAVPWTIEFSKETDCGVDWLSAYLWCKYDDNSPNWSYAASAKIKLTPFNQNVDTKELQIRPYIFNCKNTSYDGGLIEKSFGENFIKWKNLLDVKNSFVHNNSINLQVEIKVADPNDENRSRLKLIVLQQCCADSGYASIRLNVTNIGALLVVRSPDFILQNVAWYLSAYNDQAGFLGIRLKSVNCSKDVKYNTIMMVELISSRENVNPIKREVTNLTDRWNYTEINDLISLEELFKRENGFVVNNAIRLDVKVLVENPAGNVPNATDCSLNATLPEAAKLLKLECPICLQTICGQDVSCLPCSHTFCTTCITEAIERRLFCPICKAPASPNDLRGVRLPIAN